MIMTHLHRFFRIALAVILTALLFPIAAGGQVITRERNFEGDALYGYMNGGSDLYLEYGFVSLNVQEVKYEGFEYTVETFTMADEFAAFGIYSIHIFKPLRVDSLLAAHSLPGFDCLSKYQLQAACGNRYFSIVFNAGPAAAQGAEKLLLAKAGDIAGGETIAKGENLLPFLKDAPWLKPPYSGRLKFVKGELGLSNVDDSVIDKYSAICSSGLWIWENGEDDTVFFTISPVHIL